MKHRETGTTLVEFAIIGGLFFMVLFGVIEFGRALFTWNTLTEATRRGARLAAVCPVDDPHIKNVTVFDAPGASGTVSPILPGLDHSMVTVSYLQADGSTPTTVVDQVRYVRVQITGYQHQLLIPLFNVTLTAPNFQTTLPAESLGAVPDPVTGTGTWACP